MTEPSSAPRLLSRLSLMDLRVNPVSDAEVVQLATDAIEKNAQYVVAHHNLHSMYLWHHQDRMRRFYESADCIHIDGMFLIVLANLLGLPLARGDRATSLDFFPILAPEAVRNGWRVFYLGSKPGVEKRAAAKLCAKYPGLQIKTQHGYFNVDREGEENQQILREIESYEPQILLVGMGMPRQEIWILENRRDIRANVIFPVGAFMDYMAGEIATAPRWLASFYLEWLYRLVCEPKRLSRRYLIEPWFVVGQIAKYLREARAPYGVQGEPE